MKSFDSGLICGRFQTPHIGHGSLFDMGINLCDRLYILVGSSQESGTERNPLNIGTRIKLLNEIYGDNPNVHFYGLQDLTNENDITPDWGKFVLSNLDKYLHKTPDLMLYGNDEARSKWFSPEDIKDTYEFIIPRGRIAVSATMVRHAMATDNRKLWMSMVNPRLHKMYDEIRGELMEIDFYKNIYDNK